MTKKEVEDNLGKTAIWYSQDLKVTIHDHKENGRYVIIKWLDVDLRMQTEVIRREALQLQTFTYVIPKGTELFNV